MMTWKHRLLLAVLLVVSSLVPFAAEAIKVHVIPGLIGAQDSKSKELLALDPAAAEGAATRDLLSVLKPADKFTTDMSQNVEGMVFTTVPYQTLYPYVCRADRVMLRYNWAGQYDAAGKWLDNARQPTGVEAQPIYHVEQSAVPEFKPGIAYPAPVCDQRHPVADAAWFAAPSDRDAVRSANMFRMAEDEVKSGQLVPGPCDRHGSDTCRQWILSMDDPAKILSVALCEPAISDDACYVFSFDAIDITISGTIPGRSFESIVPTTIKSIRAETVS
ncbi:MAG TPA: hypothetical protein VGK90_12795, partial [Rhizomicrobium sp.]